MEEHTGRNTTLKKNSNKIKQHIALWLNLPCKNQILLYLAKNNSSACIINSSCECFYPKVNSKNRTHLDCCNEQRIWASLIAPSEASKETSLFTGFIAQKTPESLVAVKEVRELLMAGQALGEKLSISYSSNRDVNYVV